MRTAVLQLTLTTLIVTVAWPLEATTVVRMTNADLVSRAEQVVWGVCTEAASYREPSGLIVTRYTFSVQETVKGEAGETFSFVQPGGFVGDRGLHIAGVARFAPGDEAVLCVAPPERAGGVTYTVGLAQGGFRVERDRFLSGSLAAQEARVSRDLDGLEIVGGAGFDEPGLTLDGLLDELRGHARREREQKERRQ